MCPWPAAPSCCLCPFPMAQQQLPVLWAARQLSEASEQGQTCSSSKVMAEQCCQPLEPPSSPLSTGRTGTAPGTAPGSAAGGMWPLGAAPASPRSAGSASPPHRGGFIFIPVGSEPGEGGCPGCSASAENSFLVEPWCPRPPCPSEPRTACAKEENHVQPCFPHGKGEGWN